MPRFKSQAPRFNLQVPIAVGAGEAQSQPLSYTPTSSLRWFILVSFNPQSVSGLRERWIDLTQPFIFSSRFVPLEMICCFLPRSQARFLGHGVQ